MGYEDLNNECCLLLRDAQAFLNDIIASRRDQGETIVETTKKDDILSQLLEAHDSNEKLTTSELIGTQIKLVYQLVCVADLTHMAVGNIFIFMIAGHETTAHTLAFILGLLALYPDVQDRLVRHIAGVQPTDRDFVRHQLHLPRGQFLTTSADL